MRIYGKFLLVEYRVEQEKWDRRFELLLNKDWKVYPHHMYREANRCINLLDRTGREQSTRAIKSFFLYQYYVRDVVGLGRFRECPMN